MRASISWTCGWAPIVCWPIWWNYFKALGSWPLKPGDIEEVAEKDLILCKAIGWKMIKKHHWVLHLGSAPKEHKIIVGCWTTERKHNFSTKMGTTQFNTRNFGKQYHGRNYSERAECSRS